jgi:hypothetical protein
LISLDLLAVDYDRYERDKTDVGYIFIDVEKEGKVLYEKQ